MSDHWFGRQSLAWSFWVNLLGLRCVLFVVQEEIAASLQPDQILPVWLMMPLVVLVHGCFFIWQAVGLLRAADHHSRSSGQMFHVWGTHLTLIVSALWVLSYSLEAWHLTQPDPDSALPSLAELDAERATKFSLTLSSDQRSLAIEGSLELGITARLTALLEANPDVSTIHLNSFGGNIFEARGLAAQIQARALSTSVDKECSSACTLVFIGGTHRTLLSGAKLGFHQYRLDTDTVMIAVDPKLEQERDIEAFRRVGVDAWFLEQLYQSDPQEMWYPDVSKLLEAGVITEVVRPFAAKK